MGGQSGDDGDGSGGKPDGSSGDPEGSGGDDSGSGGDTSGSGGTTSTDPEISTEPFDCGSRDVTGATVVSGIITTSTTWSGIIHVNGDLSIQNEATLTIAAGTKIIVGHGVAIEFGWENSKPTLIAEGTVEAPILFCGEADTTGYWKHLLFEGAVKPTSVLQNVLISGAGSPDAGANAALVVKNSLLLRGVQIVDSGSDGFWVNDFEPESAYLHVQDSVGILGRLLSAAATDLPDYFTFEANSFLDTIDIDFDDVAESITFEYFDGYYRQLKSISHVPTVETQDVTITFEPGVIYELPSQVLFKPGAAQVIAEGTEALPIRFQRGYLGNDSSFKSGALSIASTRPSSFVHVNIVELGYYYSSTTSYAALQLGGQIEHHLENVWIDPIFDTALTLSGPGGLDATSSGIDLDGTFETTIDAMVKMPADTQYTGSILLSIRGTADGITLTDPGVPFRSKYAVTVRSGDSLTIAEGVEIKFEGADSIDVRPGGSLSIEGTLGNEVVLTAQSLEWGGIDVRDSNVTIDHAIITDADFYDKNHNYAAIRAYVPFTLTNTLIYGGYGSSVLHSAGDTTDYLTSNDLRQGGESPVGELTP